MPYTRTLKHIDPSGCPMVTMPSHSHRLPVLLALALIVLITPALGYASSHDPLIKRVEVDEATNRMKIIGVNFNGGELDVTLEGVNLHIISWNPTEILVYLPAGINPGTSV